jgi:hypothetical protein
VDWVFFHVHNGDNKDFVVPDLRDNAIRKFVGDTAPGSRRNTWPSLWE